MPAVGVFFGVVIMVDADDHESPCIRARYQGHEASFTFDGEFLEGDFPSTQRKLVEAWTLLHADELQANWKPDSEPEHPSESNH